MGIVCIAIQSLQEYNPDCMFVSRIERYIADWVSFPCISYSLLIKLKGSIFRCWSPSGAHKIGLCQLVMEMPLLHAMIKELCSRLPFANVLSHLNTTGTCVPLQVQLSTGV